MNHIETDYNTFKKENKGKNEGIICLGAGGDTDEWINGITDLLVEEEIVKGDPKVEMTMTSHDMIENLKKDMWTGIYKLTTTGGRIDLAFIMNPEVSFDLGKMSIWRIKFGDCSWVSDYFDNYEDHHLGGQNGNRI
jgi:hypothetical protein